MWRRLSKAASEIPSNPRAILAALVLTGLAASLVLAREAMESVETEGINRRGSGSDVFRSPHPAIVAPDAGWPDP